MLVTFETAKKGKSRKSEYEAEGREEPAPRGGDKSNLLKMDAAGRGSDGAGEDAKTEVGFWGKDGAVGLPRSSSSPCFVMSS